MEPVEAWVRAYGLQPHPEGGSFSESYTASDALAGGRSIAGSIYFLLRGEEISHLHQIDCEEVWFYHAGGGLIVTVIDPANGNVTRLPLGPDVGAGQHAVRLGEPGQGLRHAGELRDGAAFRLRGLPPGRPRRARARLPRAGGGAFVSRAGVTEKRGREIHGPV